MTKITGYGMPLVDVYQNIKIPLGEQGLNTRLVQHLRGTNDLTFGGQIVTGNYGLAGLFHMAGGDRQYDHILIFPTLADKNLWYRDSGTYQEQGLGVTPYLGRVDLYMDGNGVEVESPRDDPALIPCVPRVMREWLIRYGIFDMSGVAKLRPMVPKWWTNDG